MTDDVRNAYNELKVSFSRLNTDEKRSEIADKLIDIAEVLNTIKPIDNIDDTPDDYTSEDEYLCYLNGLIYNLENKIGNIFTPDL